MPTSKQKVRDRDYYGEYQKKSCYTVEQWQKIITNEAFVSPTELAILKEIFLSANHAAPLLQLAYRHKKDVSYYMEKMNQLASNIGRPNGYSVDVDLEGNEYWWYLLFWGKKNKLAGLEWKLLPELAEAIEYTYPQLEDQYNSYMTEIERSDQIQYTKEDSVWLASTLLLFEKVYLEHPTDIYDLLLMQYEISQRAQKVYGQDVDAEIITDNCNADSRKCVFPYLRDIDKYWRICYPGELEDGILRPEKIDYNAYIPSKFGYVKIKELCEFIDTDYCKLTDPNYVEVDESNPIYQMTQFLKNNGKKRYMDLTAPTEEDIERFLQQKEQGKEALNSLQNIGQILTTQYPSFTQTEKASWLEKDNTTIKTCWINTYELKDYKGMGPTFSILCGKNEEDNGKIIFSVLLNFPIENPEITKQVMDKCSNLTVLTSANFKVEKSIRLDSIYSSNFSNGILAYNEFDGQTLLEEPLQDAMLRFENAIQILASYYIDIIKNIYVQNQSAGEEPDSKDNASSVNQAGSKSTTQGSSSDTKATSAVSSYQPPMVMKTYVDPFHTFHMDFDEKKLDQLIINDIIIKDILSIMNKRLTYLIGNEYQIGHELFLPLRQEETLINLGNIMYDQVLPFLLRCFKKASYENAFEGISLIFGDYKKSKPEYHMIRKETYATKDIFGGDLKLPDKEVYRIQKEAFYKVDSYKEI